jgi:hypothetical protein
MLGASVTLNLYTLEAKHFRSKSSDSTSSVVRTVLGGRATSSSVTDGAVDSFGIGILFPESLEGVRFVSLCFLEGLASVALEVETLLVGGKKATNLSEVVLFCG